MRKLGHFDEYMLAVSALHLLCSHAMRAMRPLTYPARLLAIVGTLLLALTEQSSPHTAEDDLRPSIGIALSGGGARGFAHIGVLEFLEEKRIPVDYIAGTSMGGLVGSLYAMGMSPADIRDFLATTDWEMMFRLRPGFQQLSFRRKEDQREFPNQLELGLSGGLKLPAGLSAGHDIGLLFDRTTLPYHELAHFDQLPIPFRCVAVDLEAAIPVALDDGSLSTALRATMSIPGAFAPVERQGLLLADGGMLNNIPVDVAKEMGADIVIAVDVGTRLGDRESMSTLVGVLGQAIGIGMIQSNRVNLELADYALSPDLKDLTNDDFFASGEFADLGYAAASNAPFDWERLSVSLATWNAYKARIAERRREIPPPPSVVSVAPPEPSLEAELTNALGKAVGSHSYPDAIEQEFADVVGVGLIDSIGYSVQHGELRVRTRRKPYGPAFLRFGMDVSNARPDSVEVTLKSRLTVLGLGGQGAEWRTDVQIGSNDFVASEYYRPFAGGPIFVAPFAFYEKEIVDLYNAGNRRGSYAVRRAGGGLDLGVALHPSSEFRLGYHARYLDAQLSVGDGLLAELEGRETLLSVEWRLDRQNGPVVPTSGQRVVIDAEWVFESPGLSDDVPRAEILAIASQPLFGQGSLVLRGLAGTTLASGRTSPALQYTLGGPLRLSAYPPDELRGDGYVYGSIGYLRKVIDLPLVLGRGVFAAGFAELGSAFDHKIEHARFHSSLGGGIVVESVAGAAYLGVAFGDNGAANWFLAIGRLF